MKKAIKSRYTDNVTVIERADWSIDFYDVETGRHYTRRVWYPVHGSNIYVQHRGAFYNIMIEYNGAYDPQAISRYEVVSADELEAMADKIIAHRPSVDALSWEAATRVYAYAVICNDANTDATMRDVVSDVLRSAAEPEAAQDARELEERAEIIATIEDPACREYIRATAEAHQWTPDETRANVACYAAISAANRAARALLDAYAEAIGEHPTEDDPETRSAYVVARDEITGTHCRATAANRALVADMVEAVAEHHRKQCQYVRDAERSAIEAAAPQALAEYGSAEDATNAAAYGTFEALYHHRPDTDDAGECATLDRLMGYAAEAIEAEEVAAEAREAWADGDGEGLYRIAWSDGGQSGEPAFCESVEDLARDLASAYESATDTHLPYVERVGTYERHELEAYLGDPDAYDIDAIEAEATAYTSAGVRYWVAVGEALDEIAERHDLTRRREWHMTVVIDETAQDYTAPDIDAEDEDEARELLREAWNRSHERRLHLAPDTARIIDVYSI